MSKMQPERREKVLIHNRGGFAVLAAAALVIALAGFGCESERRAVPGGPASSDGTTGDTRTSYTWTTYESPTLGITIPYPEGWYVAERTDAYGSQLTISPVSIPEELIESDLPYNIVITITDTSLEDALQSYDDVAQIATTRLNGRNTTQVNYESRLGSPENPKRTSYHWIANSKLYTVDSEENDAVALRIANDLIANGG